MKYTYTCGHICSFQTYESTHTTTTSQISRSPFKKGANASVDLWRFDMTNDSDQGMRNIILLEAFGWTLDLLKHTRGTSHYTSSTFGFFFFHSLSRGFGRCHLWFDSIRRDNNTRIRRHSQRFGSLAIWPYPLWNLWTVTAGGEGFYSQRNGFLLLCLEGKNLYFSWRTELVTFSTGGMTAVETISMWLTMMCVFCYIGYNLFVLGKDMLRYGHNWVNVLLASCLYSCCFHFCLS